jgi:hypothetical protein
MIKIFEAYEKEKEILDWLKEYDRNFYENIYTINKYGEIDVHGSVDIHNKNLASIPYKFGVVSGDFNCANNKLDDLLNSPNVVVGDYDCGYNIKLTSLENSPAKASRMFLYAGTPKLIKVGGCKHWLKNIYQFDKNNTSPLGAFRLIFNQKELNLIAENSDLFDKLDVFRIQNEAVVFNGRAFVTFLRKLKQDNDYNLDVIHRKVQECGCEVDE